MYHAGRGLLSVGRRAGPRYGDGSGQRNVVNAWWRLERHGLASFHPGLTAVAGAHSIPSHFPTDREPSRDTSNSGEVVRWSIEFQQWHHSSPQTPRGRLGHRPAQGCAYAAARRLAVRR